ncbi:MAG TPA: DUF1080 domain-containing protein [Pirellulales bacterium]
MSSAAVLAASFQFVAIRSAGAEEPKVTAGFKLLFNGKDLTGWDGLDGFWSVKDGAISGAEDHQHAAPQTFLICNEKFSDFELHYKYKFATPTGNSGVQFRSKVLDPKQHRVGGYQADCDAGIGFDGTIYDEAGVAGGRGTMSNRGEKTVWNAETKRHTTPLSENGDELKKLINKGDWNDVVLVAKGNHVTYTINGHLMTDMIDESPKALKEGVIALQLHAGFVMDIQFKDIEIKNLSESAGK